MFMDGCMENSDIVYHGEQLLDNSKGESESEFQKSFSSGSMYKIPLPFDEILRRDTVNLDNLIATPTFVAWRLGISDRFLDEALLPKVCDLVPKPAVLMPLWRYISSKNLTGEIMLRRVEELDDPKLIGESALLAYKKLKDESDVGIKQFFRRYQSQKRLIFSVDQLLKTKHSTQELSDEQLGRFRMTIAKLARSVDPIFIPETFLTIFLSRSQKDGVKVIRRVVEQIEEGVISRYQKRLVILLESFGPLEENLLEEARVLMQEGLGRGVVLWLHATIAYTPKELLDQFHNHILLLPSQSELRMLSQVQNIDLERIKSHGGNRNVAIISSMMLPSWKTWDIVQLSDIRELIEREDKMDLDPISLTILQKAVDFLFDQARKLMEDRRESRKKMGEAVEDKSVQKDIKETKKDELGSLKPIPIRLQSVYHDIEHCMEQIEGYQRNRRDLERRVMKDGGFDRTQSSVRNELRDVDDEIKKYCQKLKKLVEDVYGRNITIIGLD